MARRDLELRGNGARLHRGLGASGSHRGRERRRQQQGSGMPVSPRRFAATAILVRKPAQLHAVDARLTRSWGLRGRYLPSAQGARPHIPRPSPRAPSVRTSALPMGRLAPFLTHGPAASSACAGWIRHQAGNTSRGHKGKPRGRQGRWRNSRAGRRSISFSCADRASVRDTFSVCDRPGRPARQPVVAASRHQPSGIVPPWKCRKPRR